jgi:uncharacterized protein YjdB
MQTSHRPKSFYQNGIVKVSGVYMHLDKTELNIGEKISFKVIVAPANAANKKYTLKLTGNSIRLDEKNNQITGLKEGKSNITATTKDGKIQWTVDVDVK